MGCQSTSCRSCGKKYPACQLKNGLCNYCIAKK